MKARFFLDAAGKHVDLGTHFEERFEEFPSIGEE